MHHDFISQLSIANDAKIILLVLDGVGGIHTVESPQTALEKADTPNLDRLADRSALGRSLPTDVGITPGSGPGHLALLGYDPLAERHQIGRGVLEALGIDYELRPGEVAARGNFATLGADGLIEDRRAGRPSNEECKRIAGLLDSAIGKIEDVEVKVLPVREHRFCVMFHGPDLDPALRDTDPQQTGIEPLAPKSKTGGPNGERTERIVQAFIDRATDALRNEERANGLILRGFSAHPGLPTFDKLYKLNPAAVAYYPLYRGVASLAGMKILETGPSPAEQFETVKAHWQRHDFFFIHIKKTDSYGEDGDLEAKADTIEAVDRALPILLDLKPDVIAITGDHSTPAVMKAHSWHPVPLLIHGPNCDIDPCDRFDEMECTAGSIGDIHADRLMGLMMANAGKLAKFGA